ncbi:MAG: hypothetical protein PWR07_720, partial [Bacillota bacterium]|nr:hypothetical protein [Bacillota bacterium]
TLRDVQKRLVPGGPGFACGWSPGDQPRGQPGPWRTTPDGGRGVLVTWGPGRAPSWSPENHLHARSGPWCSSSPGFGEGGRQGWFPGDQISSQADPYRTRSARKLVLGGAAIPSCRWERGRLPMRNIELRRKSRAVSSTRLRRPINTQRPSMNSQSAARCGTLDCALPWAHARSHIAADSLKSDVSYLLSMTIAGLYRALLVRKHLPGTAWQRLPQYGNIWDAYQTRRVESCLLQQSSGCQFLPTCPATRGSSRWRSTCICLLSSRDLIL